MGAGVINVDGKAGTLTFPEVPKSAEEQADFFRAMNDMSPPSDLNDYKGDGAFCNIERGWRYSTKRTTYYKSGIIPLELPDYKIMGTDNFRSNNRWKLSYLDDEAHFYSSISGINEDCKIKFLPEYGKIEVFYFNRLNAEERKVAARHIVRFVTNASGKNSVNLTACTDVSLASALWMDAYDQYEIRSQLKAANNPGYEKYPCLEVIGFTPSAGQMQQMGVNPNVAAAWVKEISDEKKAAEAAKQATAAAEKAAQAAEKAAAEKRADALLKEAQKQTKAAEDAAQAAKDTLQAQRDLLAFMKGQNPPTNTPPTNTPPTQPPSRPITNPPGLRKNPNTPGDPAGGPPG